MNPFSYWCWVYPLILHWGSEVLNHWIFFLQNFYTYTFQSLIFSFLFSSHPIGNKDVVRPVLGTDLDNNFFFWLLQDAQSENLCFRYNLLDKKKKATTTKLRCNKTVVNIPTTSWSRSAHLWTNWGSPKRCTKWINIKIKSTIKRKKYIEYKNGNNILKALKCSIKYAIFVFNFI